MALRTRTSSAATESAVTAESSTAAAGPTTEIPSSEISTADASSSDFPTAGATTAPSSDTGPTTATPLTSTSQATPTRVGTVTVVATIATGLSTPWGLGFLPDGTALVTERGTAHLMSIGAGAGHPVRTIGTVSGVQPAGEGGLLGIAVDPDFPSTATCSSTSLRRPTTGSPSSP